VGSRVLLVSGSLRAESTNAAVLRTAQAEAPPDLDCALYRGLGGLPHFNPDDDAGFLPAAVSELRAEVHRVDALVFCTPEYAGALPGSLKNLLEWLIGDDDARSIYRKPVAWINASPRGATDAHDSLAKVLGYAHASVLDEVNAEIPVSGSMIGSRGEIEEEDVRLQIRRVMATLRDRVCSGTRE
jgi:chromate reductase, NAD(P)H dehydrogenase (quinone)